MKNKKDILDHLKPVKVNAPGPDFFEVLAKKVVDDNPKESKEGRIRFMAIKMSLAVAAVLIIAAVLFKDFSNQQKPQQAQKEFLSEINDDEIYAYVEAHIDEFSIEEISESLSKGVLDIDYTNSGNELEFYFADISDEEIIEYIYRENIDLDELEDELLIF